MRICPGCGAIAPTERTTCVRCKASLAAPLVINDPVTGFWVGVECGFKCRACGHTSPLNFLYVDGDVRCLRCGIEQEFARDQWWDGLEVAHAAGDLTGPVAGGRFPTGRPLASSQLSQKLHQIGIEKTFVESSNRGVVIDGSGVHTRSLLVRALPGHPLCDACKRPLDVTACEHGDLSVRCPGCGDARTYWRPRLPKSLQALAGLVAPELEKGGREAKVDKDASGAAVIGVPELRRPARHRRHPHGRPLHVLDSVGSDPVGDPARRRPRPPEAGALVAVLHRGVAPAPAARAAGRGERRQGRAPGGATGGPAPLRVDRHYAGRRRRCHRRGRARQRPGRGGRVRPARGRRGHRDPVEGAQRAPAPPVPTVARVGRARRPAGGYCARQPAGRRADGGAGVEGLGPPGPRREPEARRAVHGPRRGPRRPGASG